MTENVSPIISKIGVWSAIVALIFGLGYIVAQFAMLSGVFVPPWDLVALFVPSLLLAPVFVVLMISVHYYASAERKIWSHMALTFATVYAVLVSTVYFTQLTVVIPNILQGQSDKVALLLFNAGSFMVAVDGLGYGFMSMAALSAAAVFAGKGLVIWTRRALIAHGLLAPIIIGAVIWPPLTYVGALWVITFPLSILFLAVIFKRSGVDTT